MASSGQKMINVHQELVVNTYADLWHGAEILKEKAVQNQEGSIFVSMASLCMFAFSAEAYTNFVGPRLFPVEWFQENRPYERRPILKKYRLICCKLGVIIDDSSSAWILLNELVQFRDTMAHGKQETVVKKTLVPLQPEVTDYLSARLEANWHQYCNVTYIEQIQREVGSLLVTIHKALRAICSEEDLGTFGEFGMGHGSAVLVEHH